MSEKFAISQSLRRGLAERRSVGQALNFGEESVGHLKEVPALDPLNHDRPGQPQTDEVDRRRRMGVQPGAEGGERSTAAFGDLEGSKDSTSIRGLHPGSANGVQVGQAGMESDSVGLNVEPDKHLRVPAGDLKIIDYCPQIQACPPD